MQVALKIYFMCEIRNYIRSQINIFVLFQYQNKFHDN